MKKRMKIIVAFLLMLLAIFVMFQIVSEATYSEQMGNLLTESDNYTDPTNTADKVNSIASTLLTAIRVVGVAVAIVMLMVIAMKYMTAAPGEKADIKKSAIQYVVGAIVLFGVIGILEIISKFATAVK